MQTIFDFAHLRKRAYFLDTQCASIELTPRVLYSRRGPADRMPVPLGDFVSKEVYRSQLKSVHDVISRDCVKAIDVRKGVEEGVGTSWKVRRRFALPERMRLKRATVLHRRTWRRPIPS